MWPGLEAIAHTLAYDAACIGTSQPPVARLATITQPALVLTGGAALADSNMPGLRPDFFGRAADAIAACVPRAQRYTADGQQHVVDPKTFAPLLRRFLTGPLDVAPG